MVTTTDVWTACLLDKIYAGDEQFYSWTSFLMVLQLLHFDTWFEVNMKCC